MDGDRNERMKKLVIDSSILFQIKETICFYTDLINHAGLLQNDELEHYQKLAAQMKTCKETVKKLNDDLEKKFLIISTRIHTLKAKKIIKGLQVQFESLKSIVETLKRMPQNKTDYLVYTANGQSLIRDVEKAFEEFKLLQGSGGESDIIRLMAYYSRHQKLLNECDEYVRALREYLEAEENKGGE